MVLLQKPLSIITVHNLSLMHCLHTYLIYTKNTGNKLNYSYLNLQDVLEDRNKVTFLLPNLV